MPKQDFARVTIDTTTYEKLTQLANTAKLSRAEYIRRLIWSQHSDSTTIPEPVETSIRISAKIAALTAQGISPVVRHDEVLPLADLPIHLRAVTELANYFGVTIDRRKWQRYAADAFAKYLDSMVDFIRAEGKPIKDSQEAT